MLGRKKSPYRIRWAADGEGLMRIGLAAVLDAAAVFPPRLALPTWAADHEKRTMEGTGQLLFNGKTLDHQ